jgi:uncharacterized membrane protein YuzA (DUF378 family)
MYRRGVIIFMKMLHMVSFTLLIIGGLNWGLWALFNLNLVETVLGAWPSVAKLVYILVGVSAVYIAATHMSDCRTCSAK